jgi:hypothetical protein
MTKVGSAAHRRSGPRYQSGDTGEQPQQLPLVVNLELREVVELKPNNPRAIRRGEKQLESYLAELEREYPGARPWSGHVSTYEPP